MTNTFSEFIAAYQKAAPDIKAVIDGEEIGLFIDTLTLVDTKNTPGLKPKLLVLISNLILEVNEMPSLKNSLVSLNLTDPLIFEEIKFFVTSKQGVPVAKVEVVNTPPVQNQETINTLRTMEGDGKQIGYGKENEPATYTTMQSAILQEGSKKPNP